MSLTVLSRHFKSLWYATVTKNEDNDTVSSSATEFKGRIVKKSKLIKGLDSEDVISEARVQSFTALSKGMLIFESNPGATPDISTGQRVMTVESATALSDGAKMFVAYL